MGFIKGYYVPTSEEIINNAFSAAKKEAEQLPKQANKDAFIKAKEKKRIKIATEKVNNIFKNIVKNFPSVNNLIDFYKVMLENSIDIVKTKKALSHLNKTEKLLNELKQEYLIKINKRQTELAGKTRKEYYGRLKSIVERTQKSLDIIKEAYRVIAEIPKVKDLPTIILIGLPNVGKSTLLKNLTGSNVEIKSYPFTTKKIQIAYLEHKYLKFQLVDSPGLLDRPEKKQNVIEKKTVIALKHLAHSIIGVIDVSQELKPQKNLIKKYIKEKPAILVFNKIKLNPDYKEYVNEFLKEIKINKENVFMIDQEELDHKTKETLDQIKERIYKLNKDFYK